MKNFIKEHITACIITAGAAVLIIAAAIILSLSLGKEKPADSDAPLDTSSTQAELNIENPEDESSTDSSALPDSDNYISPDETVANDILSDNQTSAAPSSAPSSGSGSTGTVSKPVKNTDTPTASSATSSTGGTNTGWDIYVKDADPKTGISWDGKSQIVYTYSDGSTGTVPVVGATYERYPNHISTVDGCFACGKIDCPGWYDPNNCVNVTIVPWDGTCYDCGRVSGNGTNGTCIKYSLINSDMPCPSCGVIIPKHTCHTCDE